ncbi:MAG: hypothetical protein K2F90_04715 [Clostridiales bacterium]|nr:hypothetical protein [Clostridiales bacterium]
MKISTRSITLAATLAALCAVTGLFPFVFFLPVMVAATTLTVGMTAFVGLAFGCISFAYCFIAPTPSFAALGFMQAPYIAIIPRILAALGAFGAYKLIQRLCKPKRRVGQVAAVSVSAAIGSLLNTGIVVTMFVLILPNLSLGGVTMIVAAPEMLISGAIECACMAVIVPPVSVTLNRVVLRRKDKLLAASPQTASAENDQRQNGDI